MKVCSRVTLIFFNDAQGILDGEEDIPGQRILSTGSHDSTNPEDLKHLLLDSLSRLAGAVNNFLVMYAKAFRVDFTVDRTVDATKGKKENWVSVWFSEKEYRLFTVYKCDINGIYTAIMILDNNDLCIHLTQS